MTNIIQFKQKPPPPPEPPVQSRFRCQDVTPVNGGYSWALVTFWAIGPIVVLAASMLTQVVLPFASGAVLIFGMLLTIIAGAAFNIMGFEGWDCKALCLYCQHVIRVRNIEGTAEGCPACGTRVVLSDGKLHYLAMRTDVE